MHADERPWHRRIAGQEQRFAFFQKAGKSVADRIGTQIWPVVADTDNHRGRFVFACNFKIQLTLLC